jgi:flagellar assembly factor FliW
VNNRLTAGVAQDGVDSSALCGVEFFLPAGLLGFPACRRYKLERFNPGEGTESPFFLFTSLEQDLSFPLVHPATIALDYCFPVNPDVLRLLRATSEESLVPFLIVTVRERLEQTTLNLQGPVIVNPLTSLGVQLVLEDYPVRHPLFTSVGS